MRNLRTLALFGLMLFVAAGCTLRRGATPDLPPAEVTVINRATDQLTIFVYRGVDRVRLGWVSPGDEETFRIPDRLLRGGVQQLRFTAEPPGRRVEVASLTQNVAPGTHVELFIR